VTVWPFIEAEQPEQGNVARMCELLADGLKVRSTDVVVQLQALWGVFRHWIVERAVRDHRPRSAVASLAPAAGSSSRDR
jgi:hypothetical protein